MLQTIACLRSERVWSFCQEFVSRRNYAIRGEGVLCRGKRRERNADIFRVKRLFFAGYDEIRNPKQGALELGVFDRSEGFTAKFGVAIGCGHGVFH